MNKSEVDRICNGNLAWGDPGARSEVAGIAVNNAVPDEFGAYMTDQEILDARQDDSWPCLSLAGTRAALGVSDEKRAALVSAAEFYSDQRFRDDLNGTGATPGHPSEAEIEVAVDQWLEELEKDLATMDDEDEEEDETSSDD